MSIVYFTKDPKFEAKEKIKKVVDILLESGKPFTVDDVVKLCNSSYVFTDPKFIKTYLEGDDSPMSNIKRVGGLMFVSPLRDDDKEVENLVDDVVVEWVAEGREFTAYDVTQEIRRREPSLNVRHRVVRDVIHDDFESGRLDLLFGYGRRLSDKVGENGTQPWIYEPAALKEKKSVDNNVLFTLKGYFS